MTNQNIESIPFARPSLGQEEEEAVLKVLRSGWLTTGKEAQAFEDEFIRYTGAAHALAVNSATAGLHLILEALGVKEGDKVLTSSYTFTATAEVIRYCGGDPVFVDLAPGSMNMDPKDCEKKIKKLLDEGQNVKGILPVHIAGNPEGLEELFALSRRYGLFLVEDAAHCFPVPSKKGMIGTWTDAGVYSFYANKTITTGEGGMIVFQDPQLKERISAMRLHGIDKSVWDRYTSLKAPWEYDVIAPGFKYNLNDIAATIGRVQLRKAKELLNKRKALVQAYRTRLKDADFLDLPTWKEDHAWHLFIISLRLDKLNIDRNQFMNILRDRGIGTSVHYKPLHMMTYYRERYKLKEEDLPLATGLYHRVISLPLFPDMTMDQLERVCQVILETGESHRSKAEMESVK
ncbi:DegT/DnrJ/EryC1/StrS family aminotransferase [Oceanispirochaeta crateris]|uniref:DegT/DnrJ/EryC1/StrS family aminotransferase n=1 Tax=Oceanispirochaeta crateris TaxID=2518645 RepID=A0A5C1QIH3_9SPIO|nr:DegT/DnrJ/EryC1/StrS family aminotransferase [Oceanispirochaeta crateris]QEN07953.1 DegT/DnrJ/EryC1/StrS family aminotransferase [Oceanispirochaeta crateris]